MTTGTRKPIHRWRFRRHTVQALVVLTFLLLPMPIPWIKGLEHGLLKINFSEWRVHFFGLTLVPGLLHLFSLAIMLLPFIIAVIATLWSKAFCGWLCPQNIIYESFERVHGYLRKYFPIYRKHQRLQKLTDLVMALAVAGVVTLVANCYFIGASPIFIGAMSLFLMTFITIDAHVWKHEFCRKACPYAFLQQSFHNSNSLHIAYAPRPDSPCGKCTACEKACYVDLDIKKDTFHIDCTLCGACVDACEKVHSRSPHNSLLRFAFEKEESKWSNFFGINTPLKIFVVSAFVLFCSFFAYSILTRPLVKFRVDNPMGGRIATQVPVMLDGKHTNTFIVNVQNLSSDSSGYKLMVDDRFVWTWNGENPLSQPLGGFEKRAMGIQVQWKKEPESMPFITPFDFVLLDEQGQEVGRQTLYFRPAS